MKIITRKFSTIDSLDIYKWRNDKSTLLMSLSSERIKLKDHMKWFSQKINNKNYIMIIGSNNLKEKIGIILYNLENYSNEVSINLNPKFRGKRLSKIFLLKSESYLNNNYILNAKIKKTNKISEKLFQSVGYVKFSAHKNYYLYKKIFMAKSNINRLNKIKNLQQNLKIIDEIEQVRKKNNKNWMDVLRLAYKFSPNESSQIFAKIYKDDRLINKLSNKLIKTKSL